MASLLMVLTLLLPVSAPAQPGPSDVSDDTWLETTTIWVFEEVDVLAAAGAFDTNPIIDVIRESIDTDFSDRADLFQTIDDFENDNVELLTALDADGRVLSPAVRQVMERSDPEIVTRLLAGETGFVDPTPWFDALADLILREGRAPIGPRPAGEHQAIAVLLEQVNESFTFPSPAEIERQLDLPSPAGEVAAPVDGLDLDLETTDPPTEAVEPSTPAETLTVDEAPAATAAASGAPVGLLAGGGAGLVALLALGFFMSRRRRPETPAAPTVPVMTDPTPPTPPQPAVAATDQAGTPGLEDLLDTSRRMTSALDIAEVRQIAVAESVRLAMAESGGFVHRDGGPLRFDAATHPALFVDGPIDSGILARVFDTGQNTCTIAQDDPALTRLPMALAAVPVIAGGGVTGAIVVLRSPDRPFGRTELDALNLLAPVVGSALAAASAHHTAVSAADVDALTGLKNRRRLDADLDALGADAPVGFAMVDVDHFKNFNDTNGHSAGDLALKTVADCLAANVRADDIVYRYGGEEFSVLLPGATHDEALGVMERVRAAVEHAPIAGGEHQPGGRVTISVGVVIARGHLGSALATQADAALYEAKDTGRNRVVTAPG